MLSYVVGFILLFVISGVGNGSVYKMIPAIFAAKSLALRDLSPVEVIGWERAMSGALIGIAGAIGALGGVGINVVLHASYASPAKSATVAFWVFLVFYLICVTVTWAAYVRRRDATSLV
jgi:NNP family nitrate/nitrite transporter-like MFS transporter